jgi:hypothetical protein
VRFARAHSACSQRLAARRTRVDIVLNAAVLVFIGLEFILAIIAMLRFGKTAS